MSLTTVQVQTRPESAVLGRPPWWWVGLQLTSLAFFIPLSWLSGTQRALVNPTSALLVAGAVGCLGILLYLVIDRFSSSSWTALAQASIALIFFWQWGAWASQGPLISWIASSLLLLVVLLAVRRVAERGFFRKALLITSVTLAGTALILIVHSLVTESPNSVRVEGIPTVEAPARTPDVIFILLDAYARSDVLAEDFSYDNGDFIAGLHGAGFDVADSANANYTATHASVASMLNMGYLELTDKAIDNSDLETLSSIVSGDNQLVSALKNYGYRYLHGSGDNWLNQCSEAADVCLPGPAMDQTAFSLLTKTPLGLLLYPETGNPTTRLNLTRIDQLQHWSATSANTGDAPLFSYIHLVLPHPPFYLDSQCQPRVDPALGGQLIADATTSPSYREMRRGAYVEQVICANSMIESFVAELEGDEIVVIASDHGPDSYGTLDSDPSTWTGNQLRERLATLTAIRLPQGCENPSDENLQSVNIFRVVLGCIQGKEIPLLQPEFHATTFSGPMVRVDDPDQGAA
jgi:Sulfatase